MIYRLDEGLSDREVFLVGQVIVQWGTLEHEIFSQTLVTFEDSEAESTILPRAMNNLQFSELLKLWKQRVVDRAEVARAGVLQQQLDEILILKPFRDALVHGMWHWSVADLSRITTTRVRKKEVITTHFSADDLGEFDTRLAKVNFALRFPDGVQGLAHARAGQASVSRRFLATVTGNRVAQDWLSKSPKPDDGAKGPDA